MNVNVTNRKDREHQRDGSSLSTHRYQKNDTMVTNMTSMSVRRDENSEIIEELRKKCS